MKLLLVVFAICISSGALTQPFMPDISGRVSGDAFGNFCKKHQYSLVGTFDSLPGRKGMAAEVIKNGAWIYVDLNGKEFINHEALAKHYGFYSAPYREDFDDDDLAEPRSEPIEMKGYPVTGTFGKSGQIGYMIQDKIIVQPNYDDVDRLWSMDNYLFFMVQKGDLFGICNYQGKEIVPVIYNKIESLPFSTAECFFLATKDKKQAVLSRGGMVTIPLEYEEIKPEVAGKQFVLFIKKNGLNGVLSSSGKTIVEPIYPELRPAQNRALGGFIIQIDGKSGYLNSKGQQVVPAQYESLYYNENDFLIYSIDRNVGALDTNGVKLLDPVFSEIVKPKSGNCFIATINENGVKRTGIYELDGKVIEEPQFGDYNEYGLYYKDNEIYMFSKEKMYHRTGLFNVKTLQWIQPCEYRFRIIGADYLVVANAEDSVENKLLGLIGPNGTFTIPCIYSELTYNDLEKLAIVKSDGKYGVIDANNKTILPLQSDKISSLTYYDNTWGNRNQVPKGYLIFTQNNLKGVMTTSGKVTIPARYGSIKATDFGILCISGDTSTLFSAEGKNYNSVVHSVHYRIEGFLEWFEGGAAYGIDSYGNQSEIPQKPRIDDHDFPNPPMPEPPAPPVDSNKLYTVVDEYASYPGGNVEMMKFIAANMNYPETALENGIQGKCYLSFVVEKDGSLTDIQVKRKLTDCPECDKEAVRVIKLMPKWNPGKVKDEAVRSTFNLPISFKYQ